MTDHRDVQRQVFVYKSTYGDSSILTRLSTRLNEHDGISQAVSVMGTPLNRRLLEASGFDGFESLSTATPMDMIVAICAEPGTALETISNTIEALLNNGCRDDSQDAPFPHTHQQVDAPHSQTGASDTMNYGTTTTLPESALIQLIDTTVDCVNPIPDEGADWPPPSLNEILAVHKDINVVSIAVPGPYAAYVAERALDNGKHVFLFSGRVSMEDEIHLKTKAAESGLLMMGPACGTAMLNGTIFGFGSPVPRGEVGIIGGGSTASLEVITILDRAGMGVSHHIDTGVRDVTAPVGGLTTMMGLRLLTQDTGTRTIILICRKPAPEVLTTIHQAATKTSKKVIFRLVDVSMDISLQIGNVYYASSLHDAALMACGGDKVSNSLRTAINKYDSSADPIAILEGAGQNTIDGQTATNPGHSFTPENRLIALMSGGASAAEISSLLKTHNISATMPLFPIETALNQDHVTPFPMKGMNLVLDASRDCYLMTRPHPMIDLQLRADLAEMAASDPQVQVLLLDLVLGYGTHHNPAPVLVAAIKRGTGKRSGPPLEVVFNLIGSMGAPQGLNKQRDCLLDAGFRVTNSSAQAAHIAAELLNRQVS